MQTRFLCKKSRYINLKKIVHIHNVATQGTSCLTSNSWGISRRARYSLASLVFISSRISTEIATYPKPFLMPSNVSAPSDNLWWTDEQETGFPSAHFCLVCGLHQIPAGDATSPPSWCGCVARPSSLLPRFANSAHHVCLALALRVCHKKPKQNHQKKSAHLLCSAVITQSSKFLPGNLEVIFRLD